MMKSTGALAFLLAAASSSSSSDAFLFFSATKHYRRQSSSSSLAATPIQGGPINEEIFSTNPPLRIEGNSLKTWSGFQSNRVQVSIKSMGRPVEASVELWQSPSVSDDCFCELTLIHLCASCNYSNFTLIYQTPSVSVSLSLLVHSNKIHRRMRRRLRKHCPLPHRTPTGLSRHNCRVQHGRTRVPNGSERVRFIFRICT